MTEQSKALRIDCSLTTATLTTANCQLSKAILMYSRTLPQRADFGRFFHRYSYFLDETQNGRKRSLTYSFSSLLSSINLSILMVSQTLLILFSSVTQFAIFKVVTCVVQANWVNENAMSKVYSILIIYF